MAKKKVTKQKKCDGKTLYTCTMEHVEESGTIQHWHAINLEELKKAFNTRPPDFTFPIDRKHEKWPKSCACPKGCRKMVRDTRTKSSQGRRIALLRTGAGGQVLELMKKTIICRTIDVDFVCVKLKQAKKMSMSFDPDYERADDEVAFRELEKGLRERGIEKTRG